MPPKKPVTKAPAKPAVKSKTTAKATTSKTTKPAEKKPAEAAAAAAPIEPVFTDVPLKSFAGVLWGELDTRVKDSGKWPLILDTTNVVATFIRHRDCNYLNAATPEDMQPERIRLALLGGLRFGKPLVLDMMDLDMLESSKTSFNAVKEDLWESIFNKKIMEEEYFMHLVKETDGDEWQVNHFAPMFMEKFIFVVISTQPMPAAELLQTMFLMKVYKP